MKYRIALREEQDFHFNSSFIKHTNVLNSGSNLSLLFFVFLIVTNVDSILVMFDIRYNFHDKLETIRAV